MPKADREERESVHAAERERAEAPEREFVDAAERERGETAERLPKAIATAYRYLNRRERTRAEMREHLHGAGFDHRDVEQAIAALVEDGQLDDACFTRLLIQDKRELEGWGNDRIRQVLLARGIDLDVIEDGLLAADGADGGGEMERALELLRRRFPAPAQDRRERDRAIGVLVRKGYDVDLALDAIAAHARGEEPL
ncbi:MAG TPA: regulatory protein RecX [Solirubrobacteraceae bacterium]|nr:regulatory protein RecX [Solirubrobacteraceae bacterium]